MTELDGIDVILDTKQIQSARSLCSKMLDSYYEFNCQWLRTNDWVAIPAEGNGPYQDEELARLSEVLAKFSVRECWAILTEDLTNKEKLYKFRPSNQNLVRFRIECNAFHYLLTDAKSSFGILCTASDYFIYAGERQLVEAILGNDVVNAKQEFLEYVKFWPNDVRLPFERVAKRYENFV